MSDALAPDIDGVAALCPQAVYGFEYVFAHSPTSAVHVDRHDLAVMVILDYRADVPLVYLFCPTGRSLPSVEWEP